MLYKFWCGHKFSFLLGVHLGVELLDHLVTMFSFFRNCLTIFQNKYTILHSHQQHPIFSTSLPPLIIICLFYFSCPSGYEMVSHCRFDLHSRWLMMLSFPEVIVNIHCSRISSPF